MDEKKISYSKLGNEYPLDFIKENDEKYHNILRKLRMKNYNKICADCDDKPANWSSVNLGIFICESCAQIHRGIGTHISKVKSCMGSYLWHPDEIENMKNIGNKTANLKFLTNIIKPTNNSTTEYKKKYILDKYCI